MLWPAMIFNLCVGLLCAGYLLRAVRRFECRADAILANYDEWDAVSRCKFAAARDEIVTSMRVKTDRALAALRWVPTPSHSEDKEAVLQFVDTARHPMGNQVPSREEVAHLPRWGRVAFAARCARRTVPLFKQAWREAPSEHLQALDKAVSVAERAAARAADADADAYADADAAARAAYAARAAAAAYAAAARAAATRHIRRDFETLRGLALANGWTDDTPVPPSVFGPLWPDGPPDRWPTPDRATTEVVVEIDIPDDTITANAVAFAKHFAAELSRLHLSGGGHGLKFSPPLEIDAPVPATAPDKPLQPT